MDLGRRRCAAARTAVPSAAATAAAAASARVQRVCRRSYAAGAARSPQRWRRRCGAGYGRVCDCGSGCVCGYGCCCICVFVCRSSGYDSCRGCNHGCGCSVPAASSAAPAPVCRRVAARLARVAAPRRWPPLPGHGRGCSLHAALLQRHPREPRPRRPECTGAGAAACTALVLVLILVILVVCGRSSCGWSGAG